MSGEQCSHEVFATVCASIGFADISVLADLLSDDVICIGTDASNFWVGKPKSPPTTPRVCGFASCTSPKGLSPARQEFRPGSTGSFSRVDGNFGAGQRGRERDSRT